MVTPGSLALRFVHSGVWTGMRALASATSWSKDRSSRTGTGIVTTVSSLPVGVDRHLQPLLRTGGDDRGGDVVDRYPRLPPGDGLGHLFLDQPQGADAVRLEEHPVQAGAELRAFDPLAGRGPQDRTDALAYVQLAARPDDPPVRPHPGREGDALAVEVWLGHGWGAFDEAALTGIGKQIFRKAIHQKTMFNSRRNTNRMMNAQRKMICSENEQIMPSCRPSSAANLISQAEHDPLAASVLVTMAPSLVDSVEVELAGQVAATKHTERITAALTGEQSAAVLVDDLDAALRVVDAYAAEHLEIQTRDAHAVAERVRSAGAIFIGPWSPVSLGDYCAGSNHVLPTGGCARHGSGLSVQTFLRGVQVIEYAQDALRDVTPHVVALAEAEDLPAHGQAVTIRFNP